ncbi:MAG: cbb3-type cytochrome c oxidase subunit 3 [Geminicoccaceae bacterium]|jgi:cytochrome c oxidase cbb3-type subunit 4|nr:cbb3-type cytochrome c oxidase subunit 3 [Geminicoccaceae bacterium]MCB9967234.1 cbb3-type cytochrome c oxidase subunit 3 [Geminicoccaceae bacterium]HRY26307.1 cbb3-type cytochrome c oxidase subunit 3 [Geminicoccaceae bacterium]
MMPSHETLVVLAKTFGLFWMMGFFVIVAVLAFRPSRKAAYERVALSILPGADRPLDDGPGERK